MTADWIFFDIGSTLVDEEKSHRERIRRTAELARKGGVTLDEGLFFEAMKQASAELLPPYVAVCDKLGLMRVKYPAELDEPYSDAARVLGKLHERFRLGIIANQPFGAAEWLERFGLLQYIEVGCYSAELGVSKPSEGIFRDALYKAHCKPENAVMVGDRLDNDIYPAKKLGMKTIWLKQGLGAYQLPQSTAYEADITVSGLSQLLAVFTEEN